MATCPAPVARLDLHVVGEPATFHGGFLDRNNAIYEALASGETVVAEQMLRTYLDDEAERLVVKAYRPRAIEQP